MADIDRSVGRPGSDGPDLGGLDEDILTADLEADLVDDLGDDGLERTPSETPASPPRTTSPRSRRTDSATTMTTVPS